MADLQPIRRVDDTRGALPFSRDEVGPTEQWVYREGDERPAVTAAVAFEDITFLMRATNGADGAPPHRGTGVVFYLYVDRDLDAFFDQVRRQPNATVIGPPADQAWEDRTFTINDPMGYTFTFAKALN